MSIAGLKKQINKANQFMSEKIGGAKGTELDDDFVALERKADVMDKLVDELMARTHELLQPNPASRAKMATVRSISRLRGQANSLLYPQPEGLLGECMIKYGRELGTESTFGEALIESGETYKQMSEIKYSLEDNVKQNFIEPLSLIQSKDLKEVNFHRKKLQGRRLDYDCKKRKKDGHTQPSPMLDDEIRMAEEKFAESKELAEAAMYNVLNNDVEQVAVLSAFIDAEVTFHQQSLDLLLSLAEVIKTKRDEAANKPRPEHIPRKITGSSSFSRYDRSPSPTPGYSKSNSNDGRNSARASSPFLSTPEKHANNESTTYASGDRKKSGPCCEALYDFEPENEGELAFKEGDIIQLITRIDENWFEGAIDGKSGHFPVNYVKREPSSLIPEMEDEQELGPLGKMKDNRAYLENRRIPQLIKGILAALAVEQPEDHLAYIREKLEQAQELGSENIDVLTFIKDKHPLENPIRHEFIQPEENVEEWYPFKVVRDRLDNPQTDTPYEPDLFELTEPVVTEAN